ncbi:unnamed protein product [Phytomonas sp. EM1]|nr:unnamed protein product [Phytomonas sp. EM1]|eukprot:CCW65901.1 unnamed protein product [Phytomonas sp. isolate EM1]
MGSNRTQELVCFEESDIDFDCDALTYNNNSHWNQKTLRRGSCSRVRRVYWRMCNIIVAYKEVVLSREDDFTNVMESSRVIRHIQAKRHEDSEDACPHLLRYYALRVIDTHHYQWLMEWVDYTLLDLIKSELFKTEAVCVGVARQLVGALHFLHIEMGLVHGDVSLANILVLFKPGLMTKEGKEGEGEGSVSLITRLGDLEGCFLVGVLPRCFHGTYLFAAPEVLAHREEAANPGVDVWSLGIVVCMLLSGGKHPFLTHGDPNFWDILGSLERAKLLNLQEHLKALLPHVNDEGVEFLCGCLSWEPAQRLSTPHLLRLPWIS